MDLFHLLILSLQALRFGEQEDEDESNDDDGSGNQQGITKFDFSILGSASKSSKMRYAPNHIRHNHQYHILLHYYYC